MLGRVGALGRSLGFNGKAAMTRMSRGISALAALALAGCGASLPNTTGSLFGGAPAAPPAPANDPTSRALQVGSIAARAEKCGFNFDPAKLRTQFIAAESAASPADAGKISQVYDTAYRGTARGVAEQGESYCSDQKTVKIKSALARHMAGDYTPDPPEPAPVEEGFFGSSSGSSRSGGWDKEAFEH